MRDGADLAARALHRQLMATFGTAIMVRVGIRRRGPARLIVEGMSPTQLETASVPAFFQGYSVAIRRRRITAHPNRRAKRP